MNKNYIGQKGYSIFRENINIGEQHEIRKELTVKPFTKGNTYCEQPSFSVYRESPKKCMYLDFMVLKSMEHVNQRLPRVKI